MQIQQLNQLANQPIENLLRQQLSYPNSNLYPIIYGKSYRQPFNYESVKMALLLLQKDGDKWLNVLERFCKQQFKMTFSMCYKHSKASIAVLREIFSQGEAQHFQVMEKYIEERIDSNFQMDNNFVAEVWPVYIEYLQIWSSHVPLRSLYSLQKIQIRLKNNQSIYDKISQMQKIKFMTILSNIVSHHEYIFMRKLTLRNFWNSIPNVIGFFKSEILQKGLLNKLYHKISNQSISSNGQINQQSMSQPHQKQQLIDILLFLQSNLKISILQQIYYQLSPRLSKLIVDTKIINYSQYSRNKIQQLLKLQNSLIFHIASDDYYSLFQQLIVLLARKITSFLKYFVQQCQFLLLKQNNDQIIVSDIILKVCILSKEIVEYKKTNQGSFDMKAIIDQLIRLSDSRSELIQLKTLKLMHYFKQILPQNYFNHYHQGIFRILKHYLQIRSTDPNQIQLQPTSQTLFQNHKPVSIYTQISFYQCVQILNEQFQKPDEQQSQFQTNKLQRKIKYKKYKNQHVVRVMVEQNMYWLFQRIADLLQINTRCQQQIKIFQVLRNMLGRYRKLAERNATCIVKFLAKMFFREYTYIRECSDVRNRNLQRIFIIVDCLGIVSKQITQQTYIQCQQHIIPILQLLKQQSIPQISDQLIKFIPLLLKKSKCITQQLCTLLILSKQYFLNQNKELAIYEYIIKELCTYQISQNIKAEWSELLTFFVTMFYQYIENIYQNVQRIQMYEQNWTKSLYLIQLFLLTYELQINDDYHINQILINIQSRLQELPLNNMNNVYVIQHRNQLLMVIHHIVNKCKLYPYFQVLNYQNYREKYTIRLVHITFVDILLKNFRSHIFDFQQSNNSIYPFIEGFINFMQNLREMNMKLISTVNDTLPINKINPSSYLENAINAIFGQKLIDIQEFVELKNKLLDEGVLINSSYCN